MTDSVVDDRVRNLERESTRDPLALEALAVHLRRSGRAEDALSVEIAARAKIEGRAIVVLHVPSGNILVNGEERPATDIGRPIVQQLQKRLPEAVVVMIPEGWNLDVFGTEPVSQLLRAQVQSLRNGSVSVLPHHPGNSCERCGASLDDLCGPCDREASGVPSGGA